MTTLKIMRDSFGRLFTGIFCLLPPMGQICQQGADGASVRKNKPGSDFMQGHQHERTFMQARMRENQLRLAGNMHCLFSKKQKINIK